MRDLSWFQALALLAVSSLVCFSAGALLIRALPESHATASASFSAAEADRLDVLISGDGATGSW
ncbi:MAG: hypothetical protein HKP27_00155 [Myxococcales bacterium]|nr:hypothetical protein [Myxococcales bacterium]